MVDFAILPEDKMALPPTPSYGVKTELHTSMPRRLQGGINAVYRFEQGRSPVEGQTGEAGSFDATWGRVRPELYQAVHGNPRDAAVGNVNGFVGYGVRTLG